MNKVIIDGIVTYEDGAWLTITADDEDVHCYVPSHAPVFEHDYVKAEGYLSASHMDANKFIVTNIKVLQRAKDKAIRIE